MAIDLFSGAGGLHIGFKSRIRYEPHTTKVAGVGLLNYKKATRRDQVVKRGSMKNENNFQLIL